MVVVPQSTRMTAEDYLAWEAHQDLRHEYIDGEVVAMTGGTVPHNDLALNLYFALRPHLHAKKCRINAIDVKVPIPSTGDYFYPDLVISCDERDRTAIKLIQFPKLIVEVLSPGTEAKDRGGKFKQYVTLPSLQEYVLIDYESISLECYRRGEGRMWLYFPYGAGEVATLESVQCEVAIDQIYENVQVPPASSEG